MAKRIKSRKARRRRQLKRRLILLGIVLLVIIGLGSCTVRAVKNKKEAKAQAELEAKEAAKLAKEQEKIKEIENIIQAAKEAGAPEDVLGMIDKNEETKEFVKNYPEKKDLPPKDTIGTELVEGEIPHVLQWDEGWGYQPYGEGTIAASGCGPTCMSMIIAGLTGDETVTPYVMAEFAKESGYMIDEGGTYAAFMKYAAEQYGLLVRESIENEEFMIEELTQGHPVVCNLGPGEYFTTVGHFIILTDYEDGMISVKDPFSIANTEKKWDYDDFKEQIIGMWSYEK